ncbi:MAG: hypothetical protein ACR2IN_09745 [Thermoleophilaceae bacterium]
MTDVDSLLSEYIARQRSGGEADPTDLVERLEGVDRRELEELIDGYLRRAPRREFDAAAYRESGAPQVVDALSRSLTGSAGLWPALLPRLRERARLRRAELVERLAGALGAADRRAKVEAYYHEMEQGLLPADGVSDRVLGALGEIVGASAETLRRAGAAIAPPACAGPAEQPAFARTALPDPAYEGMESPAAPTGPADHPADAWDEVDELFRGGGRR